MDCEHENEVSLDDDLRIAERALLAGDLEHCRFHLAGALAEAPNDPRCAGLFAEWIAGQPDLDGLFEREQRWQGDVLVEAMVYAHRGEHALAVRHVLAVLASGGSAELVFWLQQWTLQHPRSSAIDPTTLAKLLINIDRSENRQSQVLELVDCWLDSLDDGTEWEDASALMRVRLKRHAGRMTEALTLALAFDKRLCSFQSAIAVAATYRDLDDPASAIKFARCAAQRNPDDGCVWLDIGDYALDLKDYLQAMDAYEKAEAMRANLPWARLSGAAASYLHDPSQPSRAAFEQLAVDYPDESRLQWLRALTDGWLGFVPAPSEACLSIWG